MATQAWIAVTSTTIQHCWNHIGIQPATASSSHPVHADPGAWAIICEFATSEIPLPLTETRLQHHLSSHYIASNWEAAPKAVMDVEGDVACYDFLFSLLLRSSADSLLYYLDFSPSFRGCLTPKRGFLCFAPRMAYFYLTFPWTSFTSCATCRTACFLSIAQTTYLLYPP